MRQPQAGRTQNETSPSSSTSTSIGRGPCRTPPACRPSSRSTALHASSSAERLERRRDPHDRVEELGLVEHLADRLGVVDRRRRRARARRRPAARRPPPGDARGGRRRSSRARGGRGSPWVAHDRELARLGEQDAVLAPQLAVLLPRPARAEAGREQPEHPRVLARRGTPGGARQWIVRSMVGTKVGCSMCANAAGTQASVSAASRTGSAGRGSRGAHPARRRAAPASGRSS